MDQNQAILIVDDEPDLLDNLEMALAAEGYTVLAAADGLEALAILNTHRVHLIVADIAMPNMNGYQLYEHVRQNAAWITIPFIFLSARTMDSDVRYGKELGVDDYLSKPIRQADLLAAVRGKLRRGRQLIESLGMQAGQPARRVVTVGRLRLDAAQRRLWLDEEELKLSAKEFTLLECLVNESGKVLSPQELVKRTHDLDTDYVEAGSLLRPIILSLRRKVPLEGGELGSIENVRGVGYRLVVAD